MTNHLDESSRSRSNAVPWLIAFGFVIGVFLLTNSPLLASLYPYLRAGWPAFATGCWLRRVDPWPARGRAAFHFHLAMSGFRAGIAGLLSVLLIALLEQSLQRPADISAVILALSAIMGGVVTSFLFGWMGIITALRHRVRIYVVSNLRDRCHGDFTQIATMPWRPTGLNPAVLVTIIAIVAPLLAVWFIAMLVVSVPAPGKPEPSAGMMLVLMSILLATPFLSLLILSYLCPRIMAGSPSDCWGVTPPITEADP